MNSTFRPCGGQPAGVPALYLLVGQCPRCRRADPPADAVPLMLPTLAPDLAAWICAPCWKAGPPADLAGRRRFFTALIAPNGPPTDVVVLAKPPACAMGGRL